MFKSITNISAPKKWMYTPKEGEQFFFMHIPKTGGTTFRKMLTNHFPEGSYYPTQEDLLENNGRYYTSRELMNQDLSIQEKSLVIGHFDFVFAKQNFPNYKVIAFFKNPYDRVLSHLNHLLNCNKNYANVDPNEVLEIEFQNIIRIQSKTFGFQPKLKNYSVVKERVTQLDFVGISEQWEKSLQLFNKTIGFHIQIIDPKNVTKEKFEDRLTAKSRAKIISRIVPEIHTYNIAKRKFNKNLLKFNLADT